MEPVQLAERFLRDARPTRAERRRAARLGRLVADPEARELTFALTDRVLRFDDPARAMRELRDIADGRLPRGLGPLDRAGLRLAALVGTPVAPLVRARVRAETRGVIIPPSSFARYASRRRDGGYTVNVNLLGEAIIGDHAAAERTEAVVGFMRRPDVSYVSVKVSALCANLDVLAFDHSVDRICERLEQVYAVARDSHVFVNLDMEEYRDLALTVASFTRTLDGFPDLAAGIALQAYIPDSHAALADIGAWGAGRAVPVKVRIVKGANLAMEDVEAELANWVPAPYATKADVDASYLRMLQRAFDAPNLRVGVASHNLFDLAWALVHAPPGRVDIEMLEGMAPAYARAVRQAAERMVMYAPVVDPSEFSAAIAYLARRLDENSGPDNFLRALFDEGNWATERDRFLAAERGAADVSTARRRAPLPDAVNQPDTDFTVPTHRAAIEAALRVPLPPAPPPLTTTDAIDAAIARARAWEVDPQVLHRAADVMAGARMRTLAVMAHETGKTVREGDAEVSEAIDATRWAAANAGGRPRGLALVVGPWNFPYAIPANGVATALAAGCPVILKPAPESEVTAAELVRHFHEGGIPPDALQLVTCPENEVGRHLITHDAVDTVLLTGAYDTARMFLGWKPSLRLIAETSGKNAMVISAAADQDLAIHDLVRSAFGHAGQKCSAASLAILEASVYDDRKFMGRLADAVRSLRVGPATDLATMMGPLIRPPGDALARALTRLEPGEAWLVEPRSLGDTLWTPGLKTGVAAGSWFHLTECFGPVLGVMRARDLDHAIEMQNATPFGLTGGIQSLDPSEVEHWLERVQVGNAYVNRHITGAIIRRQPFGGWKRSSVGPGAKTGGPLDVRRFALDWRPGVDLATAWREEFSSAHDVAGLRSEQNLHRYLAVRGVMVAGGDPTEPLRTASRLTGVPIVDSLDDADVLRVIGPVDDDLLRRAHERNVRVDDTAPSDHGWSELPCWLREQSISRTTHRYGRVSV